MTVLETVTQNLKNEGLLDTLPFRHIILAYSGGIDSTALLYILSDLQKNYALKITAAYFHHAWRGTAIEELPLLHQNCLKANVPLVIMQPELTAPQTETAARTARYNKLTALAKDLNADVILTAHHANDQVETILFRLLRGTGVDGLSGIQKRLQMETPHGKSVPILRPLIDIERSRVEEYVQQKAYNYFNDPSNSNTSIERNYIRHELFPVLEKRFPQTKNALFRLGLVADSDAKVIQNSVTPIWKRVLHTEGCKNYLDAILFSQLSLPYQRRIIKRFLVLNNVQPDFQTIEGVLLFLQGKGRLSGDSALMSVESVAHNEKRFVSLYKNKIQVLARTDSPNITGTELTCMGEQPAVLQEFDVALHAIPWPAGGKIHLSPIRQNDTRQVLVDLSAYADKTLTLRTRNIGDKFQPLGMLSPMRFKKFLINRGIPRFERDKLPVLAVGKHILWVPGLGIDASIRLKDNGLPTHMLQLLPIGQPASVFHTPASVSQTDNGSETGLAEPAQVKSTIQDTSTEEEDNVLFSKLPFKEMFSDDDEAWDDTEDITEEEE